MYCRSKYTRSASGKGQFMGTPKSNAKSMSTRLHPGCDSPTTHQCGPTTDSHGIFWMLGFPPVPVRFSLNNLRVSGSPNPSMFMSTLVRTPSQHDLNCHRSPGFTPISMLSFSVARLQDVANHPSWETVTIVAKQFELSLKTGCPTSVKFCAAPCSVAQR